MRNVVFLGLWVLYYLLFWQEVPGINLLLFAILVLTGQRYTQGNWSLQAGEWVYIIAFLLSGLGLILHNSILSIVVFFMVNFSYFSFMGGPKKSPLEHLFYSGIRVFNAKEPLMRLGAKGPKKMGGFYAILRLVLLPLLIFILFFQLFRAGNPMFKEWSDSFTYWFWDLFDEFSWDLFWFLFLGFFLLRSILLENRAWTKLLSDQRVISRDKQGLKHRSFKILGLKSEYQMALMVFGSLNLLLVAVNLIDIRWFWFGFEMPAQFSLKEFLHEGVAYLIASLILAATVVFYFFRAKLNFYPKSRPLKILGRIWIIQNGILTISVFLRTFYYIDFHGLAYGRIVVLSTLLVVSFGLVYLFLKLQHLQTTSFLIRKVSVFAMLLLSFLSVLDLDHHISKYNLEHGRINEIDVDNYLRMHPRTYPLVYANLDRIEQQIKSHQSNSRRWITYSNLEDFKRSLDYRKDRYLVEEAKQGFWSWNLADARAVKDLKALDTAP